MCKKRTRRIAGVALSVCGALFGGTIRYFDFCLGDRVFSVLGLPAWTNGTTGTHYPALIGAILILAGMTLVNSTWQRSKRITVWTITILALAVLLSAFMFA